MASEENYILSYEGIILFHKLVFVSLKDEKDYKDNIFWFMDQGHLLVIGDW